ncbi:MAG: S8 family serine peptidase [Acidimicrobiales bacterium]|nr:S8 family serine peptidase [Acidimicrobiales bacterium]MCB9392492.1 S8 family serine peptidase [Acidimicrobiaceae bacterium]
MCVLTSLAGPALAGPTLAGPALAGTARADAGPTVGDLDQVTDPALLAELADAPPSERVVVEVVTDDVAGARADAIELGGVIVGSVPGEVVQVSLAASRVDDLAAADDAQVVRKPLMANRPVTGSVDLGPVTGENVAVTQAAAWHAQGLRGAGVRIGIVDFFDLTLWDPAEQGPNPAAAGRAFCLDTSGSAFCSSASGVAGSEHGVAVAEIVKDMAPDAELWLATVGTAADLRAAIDWFALHGVTIVTRSLGAAYDGPGDGTGPLAAVVDHAASKGITWFNSAGNDASGSYGRYVEGVDAAGYLDFQPGPGVDTAMTILSDKGCVGFDGVRWDDWNQPRTRTADYQVEIYDGLGRLVQVVNDRQVLGAPPLEAADEWECRGNVTIRIRRTSPGADPVDVVEVALFAGDLEYHQQAFSAAKPVVDSRNPALVAVGAVDPANGSTIGGYSSQGPTNDGRTKPDVSAPSCVRSSIYNVSRTGLPCFSGTSAASPSAAGFAALLAGRGLAAGGAHLAALVKHLVRDLGPTGPDNAFGAGRLELPVPPAASVDQRPAQYRALATPVRVLDTRASSPTAGAPVGPHPALQLIDLTLPVSGASAVALNVISTDTTAAGYVQVLPTMQGTLGASSTLNVASPGQVQPNFAIVPIGAGGRITLYLFAGGNVVVDLLGTFSPAPDGPVAAGRFVAVDPVRVLDTRPESGGPVPPEWTPHRPEAGEIVRVTGIPPTASAAVVNVVADQAVGSGFLRAQATGASGLTTSSGNYVAGLASGTLSIVPVGADGSISVLTSNSTHLVVDLMGWITGPTTPAARDGLFVPLTPSRAYDSRSGAGIHPSLGTRTISVTGAAVPAGASAVSMNLTSDAAVGAGYLTVYPADRGLPLISNLNYPARDPRANAGMVRLSSGGALNTLVNQTTHVIIDVNGYFTGPT